MGKELISAAAILVLYCVACGAVMHSEWLDAGFAFGVGIHYLRDLI